MPELDLDSLQQDARDERQQRAAATSREVLPLEYSTKRRDQPPFDFASAFRQFIFALGIGFATGGIISWQGSYSAWRDGEVLWIAFGAFLITLTLPWPGRIGWKRS